MHEQITPTAWQSKVLSVPEDISIALLGGRGGGKSQGILFLILRHLAQYGAAAKALVIRRSYPALREVEERLVALFYAAMPGSAYNRGDHVLRAPNGGTVELGHMEGELDFARYQGRESTLLAVDECTLWPSLRPLNLLRSNLRSPAGVPVRTIISGNPGGPGHVGIAQSFVNPRTPWVPYELEPGDRWVTAPSVLQDNPHVPASYVTQLRAACGSDRALLAAWLEGSWGAIGGAYFEGSWGPHLLTAADEDWRPGDDWSTYWSFDWGMSSPGVALGVAVPRERGLRGPGGIVAPPESRIVLCEVHSADPDEPSRGMNWPIDVWADELLAAGETYGISGRGCADDARGIGLDESVRGELRRRGLDMRPPVKASRTGGWAVVRQGMHAAKVRDPDSPWTQIHPRCLYTIETVPVLPRDPRRLEDVNTAANDHAADALRYAHTYRLSVSNPVEHLIY